MTHLIPNGQIEKIRTAPSATKISEASNLHNYIQEMLCDSHHTLLQGSYKNDTSISDINDVDVVAIRINTISGPFSPASGTSNGKISWDNIFLEIENKLRNQNKYKWTVVRDDKCIKVKRNGILADVVPAVKVHDSHLEDPISIYSFKKGTEKINYPRTHYKNGVEKNRLTNNNYKPVVRMFKNWVKNHFSNSVPVSSYQIESLVYNASNDTFYDDHVLSFIFVSDYIVKRLNQRDLLPTKITSVCGSEDITASWDRNDRNLFKTKLSESLSYALEAYKAKTIQSAEIKWRLAFNI